MSPPGPRSRSALTLYSLIDCPRSHTLRFVLALKALPHDVLFVETGKLPSELVSAGPSLTIPALLEREITLYEPRIIAEYIDERFPHPPLLPNDPIGRARMRLTGHRIEREWVDALDAARSGTPAAAQKAKSQLKASLMEADPLFKAAKFFLSNDIGWCDCLILPILWRLPSIGLPLKELGPSIDAYATRLFQTPLFQRTLTDSERALIA